MGNSERKLAQWIVETTVADIPSPVIERARGASVDHVGVTLVGAVQPVSGQIHDLVRSIGGNPDATVIGGGFQTSVIQAALANGTSGHALDYDDLGIHSVGSGWWGHPTAVLLPGLLALGEPRGVSGLQVLEAYTIGFEAACSLRRACSYDQMSRGFHATAVFGTMGAAAAASKLLNLSIDKTVTALGVASSLVSGIFENVGTMTKPLHAGHIAQSGVLAALLAQTGLTASEDFLEGKGGWANAFLGRDAFSGERFVRDLGDLRSIPDRLVYKKYPCCGGSHAILDALLGLLHENSLLYDQVSCVEIDDIPPTAALLYYSPRTELETKFSVRWATAAALRDGKVAVEQYTDRALHDSRYLDALEKVEHLGTQESDEQPVKVTIRLNNGRAFVRGMPREELLGTSKNPWDERELKKKFRENASHVLSASEVEEALAAWWNLAATPDIRGAMRLVVGQSKR